MGIFVPYPSHCIRGYRKVYSMLWRVVEMVSEKAKWKAKVVDFFNKYGLSATKEAFGVSKSSIYLWRKKLRESGGKLEVLNDKSKAPKNRRKPETDPRVIEFIKKIRKERPYLGKEKIKVLLDEYCKEKGIKSVSSSTIGRIIKRYNLFFRPRKITHFGKIKEIRRRKKLRRKGYKPERAGDLIQVDGIILFVDGIKRYILTGVDLKSKFAFAYAYSSLSSKKAQDFAEKFTQVAPFPIKRKQTDNGSEFHKYFDDYLSKKGIIHFWNYPRHPRSNSVVERFNRILKEEFVWENEDLLVDDIQEFNRRLMNYLIFYNTQRPHTSLSYLSPLKYLLEKENFSKMLWTYTFS